VTFYRNFIDVAIRVGQLTSGMAWGHGPGMERRFQSCHMEIVFKRAITESISHTPRFNPSCGIKSSSMSSMMQKNPRTYNWANMGLTGNYEVVSRRIRRPEDILTLIVLGLIGRPWSKMVLSRRTPVNFNIVLPSASTYYYILLQCRTRRPAIDWFSLSMIDNSSVVLLIVAFLLNFLRGWKVTVRV